MPIIILQLRTSSSLIEVKKIFSQMKSHPAAVDVPARWAEVREARRDMPELSDFLKIQPDKSPAVEELVQVAPKKVPPKPAESVVRPLKLQRQNIKGDQKHAVPAEAEAHPAAIVLVWQKLRPSLLHQKRQKPLVKARLLCHKAHLQNKQASVKVKARSL